jgi:type I restriction enzyme S subunit
MTKQVMKSSWKETTLGEVAEIIGGGTPKTSVAEYWNGDIPWLSVVDFNSDSRWVRKTEKTITQKGLKNSSTKILNTGDLIISARGTVGAFAQLKTPMAFNQSCYGLRAKSNSLNDFLYYLVKQNIIQFQKKTHGAVFDTITRETFDQIEILLPPLPEQMSIAAILSGFDDKIELLRRQNKTLEQIAQTIFKEWFVNFTVNGKKLKVNSKTGLPEGWRMGKLGEIIQIYGGGTPKTDIAEYWNGDIPWFSVADIPSDNNVFVIECEKHISKEGLENSSTKILPVNTTIITARGTVGKLALTGVPMAMNQSCYGITPKDGNSFFYLYLVIKESLAVLKSQVHGAVFDTITRDTLNNIETIISSDKIIGLFETIIKPVFQKILQNNFQIQTLSKLRDALLPKLMKGEIRVKDADNLVKERIK